MLNLIKEQGDIDKICLCAKDLSEPKYEVSIKKREDVGIKYCNDPNAMTECSNRMNDVYQNIDDYSPNSKKKILIVFHDMIADIMSNKKFQTIIKKLFIRCRKSNISLVFYYAVLFLCYKKCEIKFGSLFVYEYQQQKRINHQKIKTKIAINHSADIGYNNFMKIYREFTRKPCSFLTIVTTLPASDPLRFRTKLLIHL